MYVCMKYKWIENRIIDSNRTSMFVPKLLYTRL